MNARLLQLLLRNQLRRGLNQWRSLGWRSRWSLGVGMGLGLFSLIGTWLVLTAFLRRLLDAESAQAILGPLRFTRYEDIADGSARLMIVFLSCTVLSSLCLKWGQWQSLHRDADWDWFAEQPIPALPLFISRCLMESIVPQSFALFVLPFFTVLAWLRGSSLPGALALACAWLLVLQACTSAPRLLLDLWFRKLPPALVRSLRAGLNFCGAGLMIVALQCLNSEPGLVLRFIRVAGSVLDHSPAALAISGILLHSTPVFTVLGIIALTHAFSYGGAALLLREPLPQTSTWTGARAPRTALGGWRRVVLDRLHPLTRRDLQLLLRDRHFLLQVLVGPLVFALLPLGMIGHAWMQQAQAILLTLAFIAGLLFLLGAVFYILPMEGRSIWMLYTWPQTLSQFLRRRLLGILLLSAVYSLVVLAFGARQQTMGPLEIGRVLYVLWGLLCFAHILTAVAVFDYRPERNYRPSLVMSYGILLLGGLYAGFLFQPESSASLGMMLLLGGMSAAFWWHAEAVLPALLDREAPRHGSPRWIFTTWLVALYILGTSLLWLGSNA